MFTQKTVMLRDSLEEADNKFKGKIDILSKTMLTNPARVSSSRSIMFASHIDQRVNLENTEIPLLSRGVENDIGKLSTGYLKADSEYEVYAIIEKYKSIGNPMNVYTMIIYDPENDMYDIVDKRTYEELTERYGYTINTDVLDSKEVGDTIKKGEVLYRPSGYDEYMNYGYGLNAKFAYLSSIPTIEDAIIVSESLSKRMRSKEMETVRVSINDNDILVNLYGGATDYLGFPHVGEEIKNNIVCAKRRVHNNQLLYDLRDDNLNSINQASDSPSFYSGRVYDIMVYSNKPIEEIPKNKFNKQLLQYLEIQHQYYQEIIDVCDEIFETNAECSRDLYYLYKRAHEIIDPDTKFQDERGKVFSNIILELSVAQDIDVSVGQKITGRYGNKGVVSKVLPDDEMPILSTGEPVEIIFNLLGVINRLNPEQLFELSITFIMSRTYEKIKEMLENGKTYKDTNKLLLEIVAYFNEEQAKTLKYYLDQLDKPEMDLFYHEMLNEVGLPIIRKPMWEDEPLFFVLKRLYEEQPWISPYDVYYRKFGRIVKGMKPIIAGDMYIMKLKQTSSKGFSARSTGPITRRGLPDKTQRRQNHQDSYSKTPIRIGSDENNNLNIGANSTVLAQMHMLYRSSVIGRQLLSKNLAIPNKDWTVDDILADERVTNRNAEILQALMRVLGLQLEFDDGEVIAIHNNGKKTMRYNPMTKKAVYVTDKEYAILLIEHQMMKERFMQDTKNIKIYTREEANRVWDAEVKRRFEKQFGYF